MRAHKSIDSVSTELYADLGNVQLIFDQYQGKIDALRQELDETDQIRHSALVVLSRIKQVREETTNKNTRISSVLFGSTTPKKSEAEVEQYEKIKKNASTKQNVLAKRQQATHSPFLHFCFYDFLLIFIVFFFF